MNKYKAKKMYDRLVKMQRRLEKPDLPDRDHKGLAQVVEKRLEILNQPGIQETLWAYNERCRMEDREEEMI